MSIQDDLRLLSQCTAGAHENLVYVIPKHMARATKDLDMAWIMSQVVFWQQYNMTNHGTIWVVKPAKDWQAEFGMTRRKFDTAIEGLVEFGLQKKVIKSPYHNNNTSLCLRFDPQILYAKLEDSLNQPFLNVQNEQSEMAKMSNPLFTEGNTENKLKSMHPTPNGDEVRSSPKSNSTPNADTPHKPEQSTALDEVPNVSDNTQASLDHRHQDISPKRAGRARGGGGVNTSAEKSPNDYQRVTGAVAKLIFEIEDEIPANMIKRIGLVAGYLWGSNKSMSALRPDTETPENKVDNIISDLQAFVVWWGKKFENASPPRDLVKFAEHWLAFWAIRKQFYVPVKIVDTNSLMEGDNGVKIVLDRYIPSEGFTFNSEDKS